MSYPTCLTLLPSHILYAAAAVWGRPSYKMATIELQAPYTSAVEAVEGDSCNGAVLEMKEPDSRSKEDKEHLVSNSTAPNHKNKLKFSSLRKFHNTNWLRGVEIFVLSIVILVVWGLFAIPTVIYALESRKAPEGRKGDLYCIIWSYHWSYSHGSTYELKHSYSIPITQSYFSLLILSHTHEYTLRWICGEGQPIHCIVWMESYPVYKIKRGRDCMVFRVNGGIFVL